MLIIFPNATCIGCLLVMFWPKCIRVGDDHFVCKGLVRKNCSSLEYMGDENMCTFWKGA